MDAVSLSLFGSRIEAVCDEMGAVLRRTAFSPNIKDRRDYSCAVFDRAGRLCAQAAHIPVHLGSMAFAMGPIVSGLQWRPGDVVILNDPYLGGTHLPDVTAVAPVYARGTLVGFVANRAHHADIGCHSPGSMPLSRTLHEEGVLIPPCHLIREGHPVPGVLDGILERLGNPTDSGGDFAAQVSACHRGHQRLAALVESMGTEEFEDGLAALNAYGERLARQALARIPAGQYAFTDVLDDDGLGQRDLAIAVTVSAQDGAAVVDFTGTAAQTTGNVNCPLSVAAAAVFYAFRSLMPPETPAVAGSLRPIALTAPSGCLVNAQRPAAVAAGNVETSMRIVDAVLGALGKALPGRLPAASQGTMNNVAMGARGNDRAWDYYETLGGGMGAGPDGGGLSAVQTHMTNTLNTPVEALEMRYPLRVTRYQVRRGSGGRGRRSGGDGLVRGYLFLEPATVTLLTERRRHAPWGVEGGSDGATGRNDLNGRELPGKCTFQAMPGDRLTLETPGGGGWGPPPRPAP